MLPSRAHDNDAPKHPAVFPPRRTRVHDSMHDATHDAPQAKRLVRYGHPYGGKVRQPHLRMQLL